MKRADYHLPLSLLLMDHPTPVFQHQYMHKTLQVPSKVIVQRIRVKLGTLPMTPQPMNSTDILILVIHSPSHYPSTQEKTHLLSSPFRHISIHNLAPPVPTSMIHPSYPLPRPHIPYPPLTSIILFYTLHGHNPTKLYQVMLLTPSHVPSHAIIMYLGILTLSL